MTLKEAVNVAVMVLGVPFSPRMGATCSNCGSTNTHKVEVTDKGVVVKTYFECNDCGHVW